jgi:hypothetical protein
MDHESLKTHSDVPYKCQAESLGGLKKLSPASLQGILCALE